MPIQQVPGSDLTYHLISYDKDGKERDDDPSGLMSALAAAVVRDQPITDVFVDQPRLAGRRAGGHRSVRPAGSARWRAAPATARPSVQRRPDFQSLIIGFHWPSQPWGDEEFGMGGGSFAAVVRARRGGRRASRSGRTVRRAYADRIGRTRRALAAIRTIVDARAVRRPAGGNQLPPDGR